MKGSYLIQEFIIHFIAVLGQAKPTFNTKKNFFNITSDDDDDEENQDVKYLNKFA